MLEEQRANQNQWTEAVHAMTKANTLARLRWLAAVAALNASTMAALAQISTIPAPSRVESTPLAPPPGVTVPVVPPALPTPEPRVEVPPAVPPVLSPGQPSLAPVITPPPVVPVPPVVTLPGVDPNATLIGRPGDTMGVDPVVLVPKPALVITGQTTWDKGFETLADVFRRLEGEAGRLGLKVAGRPLTYFAETDDIGFRFDALLPVDRTPDGGAIPGEARAGSTPAGNALRFTHKAPYDDVDTTYEGITAYLDAKGVTVRDQFIEEYVSDLRDPSDPGFEINIYVQPR